MNRYRAAADAGLSLIELIVVVVLLGIMGSAVAMIFVNSWTAENQVTTTTQATNRGQFLGQQIERAVRNADAVQYSSDGRYLSVRIPAGGGAYACQAFWIRADAGGNSLVMSSATPAPATSGVWPGPWVDQQVLARGSAPFFSALTGTPGATIAYQFDIRTKASPVSISGRVSTRDTGVILSTDSTHRGASPCWS